MVLRFVPPVHQSRQQAKAACVISSGAHAALYKRTRDGIHFIEAGIRQPFLRGERISSERRAQSGEAQGVACVKEGVCVRRSFQLDERGGRREQSVTRSRITVGKKRIAERWLSGGRCYRQCPGG